ncbi:hypothetical protein D3C81_1907680 [compost metagenome]
MWRWRGRHGGHFFGAEAAAGVAVQITELFTQVDQQTVVVLLRQGAFQFVLIHRAVAVAVEFGEQFFLQLLATGVLRGGTAGAGIARVVADATDHRTHSLEWKTGGCTGLCSVGAQVVGGMWGLYR